MLIFGWGRTTIQVLGEYGAAMCANCHNSALFRHIRKRRWFTLFFIPVFPYEAQEFLSCAVCSRGWQLMPGQLPQALIQSLPPG